MTDQTLLPCPFCGGDGHIKFSAYELCGGFHVVCHGKKSCPLYCSDPYRPFDTEAEAIAEWNTRTTTAGLQSRLDAAEARNAEIVAALKPFAEKAAFVDWLELGDDEHCDCSPHLAGDYRRARAALDGTQGDAP